MDAACMEFAKFVGAPMLLVYMAARIWWKKQVGVVIPNLAAKKKQELAHKKRMDSLQVDKERSQIDLNNTLTKQFPLLQEANNNTKEHVKALHKRHDHTQDELKSLNERVEKISGGTH